MSWLIIDSTVVRLAFAGGIGYACWRLAEDRHRTTVGWPLLGALAGYFLQIWAVAVPLGLYRLGKLDLRRQYQELRVHERFARAIGAPSMVGDDLEHRILMVLANNPDGLYLNALAQGVGQSWRAIEAPIADLVRRRKIVVREELYFIDTTDSATAGPA